MLFWLLYPLHTYWSFFNVFRYITFRTIYAALTALCLVLLLGKWFMRKMQELQMGQVVRDDGPQSHLTKAGTPSMGGILVIGAISTATLLWAELTNLLVWVGLFVMWGFGLIGLIDDLQKVMKRHSRGLQGRWKLVGQIFFTLVAGYVV